MLSKMFKLCQPFDGTKKTNIATLVENLLGNFETIVQYNKGEEGRMVFTLLSEIMSLNFRQEDRQVEQRHHPDSVRHDDRHHAGLGAAQVRRGERLESGDRGGRLSGC